MGILSEKQIGLSIHVVPRDSVSHLEGSGSSQCMVNLGKGLEDYFYINATCQEAANAIYPQGTPLATMTDSSGDPVVFDKTNVGTLEQYGNNSTYVKMAGDDDNYFTVDLPISQVKQQIYGTAQPIQQNPVTQN